MNRQKLRLALEQFVSLYQYQGPETEDETQIVEAVKEVTDLDVLFMVRKMIFSNPVLRAKIEVQIIEVFVGLER